MNGTRIIAGVSRRLAWSLPALFGVVFLTFVLMRFLPGDPALFFISNPSAGEAEINLLRQELGLDQPLFFQFFYYIRDIFTGNFGVSLTTGQAVFTDVMERLPASLELTFCALFIALVVALPLGVIAAYNVDSLLDQLIRLGCTLGVCIPTFVSGLILIYVFYYLLGWAPAPIGRVDGFANPTEGFSGFLIVDSLISRDPAALWSAICYLMMPAITMALFVIAPLSRMTRQAVLAVTDAEYVKVARSLGLPRFKIMRDYVLRNALLPILTTIGIVFSTMLSASVLVEKIFAWPGISSYALDAVLASDYAPVQGFVLVMAGIFVILNLVIDLLYIWADPRVSMG